MAKKSEKVELFYEKMGTIDYELGKGEYPSYVRQNIHW